MAIGDPGQGTGGARRAAGRLAKLGLCAAIAAAAAELLAGPGTRAGLWAWPTGFEIMSWAAYGGIAAAAVSLGAVLSARAGAGGRGVAVAGLLVGLAAVGVPWCSLRYAMALPPIHDISTDTRNPPAFIALLPERRSAPNGAGYGGPDVAVKQLAAYPDVRPAFLGVPPAEAFGRALAAARRMGWKVAAADPADGRIEATATTLWFGFRDDVVVRVAASGTGSRVDVRSMSRVGVGDVGANARRIRKYLATLSGTG